MVLLLTVLHSALEEGCVCACRCVRACIRACTCACVRRCRCVLVRWELLCLIVTVSFWLVFSLHCCLSFQFLPVLVWTTVHRAELESPPPLLPYPTNHLCCLRLDGESSCLPLPNPSTEHEHTQKTNMQSTCLNTAHTTVTLLTQIMSVINTSHSSLSEG